MHARWLTPVLVLLSPAALAAGEKKSDAKPAAGEVLHVFRGTLDAKDPPDPVLKKSPHKAHEVQLEAGKVYQIDLKSDDFDPFLRLEDAKGKHLAEDDDSGGGLNARLLFTPERGGVYRVVVTAYPKGKTAGAYALTVGLAGERARLEVKARALHAEGARRYTQGDARAAERLWRQAADAWRQVYPKEQYPHGHIDLATSLNNLGNALGEQGKLAEARDHHEQALAIYRKVLPPHHPHLARSLNNLGSLLREQGNLDEARDHHEQALAIYKKALPPHHPDLADSLNSIAAVLQKQGRLPEARDHFERALAILKKVLPPDHPDLAQSLSMLGVLLREQGKLAEARDHHERSLAIRKKALPPGHPSLAYSLSNLGVVFREQGKMAEARDHHERSLAILEKALPPNHPDLANGLNNLGLTLREQGKLAEARACYERALAVHQKGLPEGHPLLAQSLSNLGTLLQEQGELAEARDRLERALAIFEKALPAGHPHLAQALNNLALALREQGKLDEARDRLERAIAINGKALPPDHPNLADSLNSLGVVLQEAGRPEEAWRHLSGCCAAWAAHVNRVAIATAQRDHPDLLRQRRHYLDFLLSAASEGEMPPGRPREVLLRLLESKGVSTSALERRRHALLAGADGESRALAGRLTERRRRLADLLVQGAGRLDPEQCRRDCVGLQDEADRLERALALRLRDYAELRQAESAGPEELAARLGPGAVLVETVRYQRHDFQGGRRREGRYAAALLWRDGAEARGAWVSLGAAEPLERAIAAWRAAAQKGQGDAAADRALRRLLWEPLAKALPAKTTRLVIAPDAALSLLAFEALTLEDDKYLVERYAVSYASGGRDLMPRPAPAQRPDTALVLADPVYDATEGGAAGPDARPPAGALRFNSLPGFAREADAAAKLLGGRAGWRVERLDRRAATEEALLKVLRPRLLYLITHGFFLEDVRRDPHRERLRDLELVGGGRLLPSFGEDPRLRSGLASAGANKWQERSAKGLSDGLLTALEVENLDLWGTELVLLSACDTGLEKIQNGEGVLGLRRAFQLAGAQTVLASLWKVPDAETEQLMTDTLSRWLKGAPPHEALREAQLELIRHLRQTGARNGKQDAPPLYWAGFVCHGSER